MGSEQVAQVLRKVGQHVKLVIARLVTDESNIDASSTVEVRIITIAEIQIDKWKPVGYPFHSQE